MKFYTPFQLDIEESNEFQKDFDERTKDLVIEDDVLIKYAQNYIESYCNTINQYFNEIKNYVSICINYPYRISIYRIGPNGVCFFYKPDETETISVYRPEDLDDSIESMNLFEVAKVFEPIFYKFDFRPREYSLKEAEIDGIKQALSSAFAFFWNAIDEKDFIELCDEVVLLENYKLLGEKRIEYKSFDEICEIKINEPAGFRRVEKWGFDYKHFRNNRITVKDIHRVEQLLRDSKNQIDIACLVTSGDITSIGSEISVENSRIRVWDRAVLENILHDNLELLSKYFSRYSNTVEKLEKSFQESKTKSKYSYFESQIRNCGYGRENFSNYEKIVTEVLSYLFEKDVGTPRVQERTIDEVHRRDTLYRNLRNSNFFKRIYERFDADFIIVDFKNYSEPIKSSVLNDVEKYANKALGSFVLIVSRKGAHVNVVKAQSRIFRDRNIIVLVVSDDQLVEMLKRKDNEEMPSDILEDMLDDLLIRY